MTQSAPWLQIDPAGQRQLWDAALGRGGDYGEVYHEYRTVHTVELDRSAIKSVKTGATAGAGLRVLSGPQIGYVHTQDLSLPSLVDAAGQAAYIASGHTAVKTGASGRHSTGRPSTRQWPDQTSMQEKADLLREADAAARARDVRISQVTAYFFDECRHITVLNSDGVYRSDSLHLSNCMISCIAEQESQRDFGHAVLGGRVGFNYYTPSKMQAAARRAATQAVRKLGAQSCPAGVMPVVIGKGWGGVLVHEAVGHGLEGDFVRKKTSLYTGKTGQQVASSKVTIIDDGTIRNGRGTVPFDDEGAEPQKTVLIKDGVLQGFLYDRLNAQLMGVASTGNSRRESFAEFPMPRMTNTYIDQGDDDPADLIASVKQGLYARQLGGGQVDITSGNFVFEVSEGQLIENGRLTTAVRGATLVGNGPDAMTKVTGVGSDLKIDKASGTCGKDGQSVFVGVGQPTILISGMTVGGTQA
jgi:TldD protein